MFYFFKLVFAFVTVRLKKPLEISSARSTFMLALDATLALPTALFDTFYCLISVRGKTAILLEYLITLSLNREKYTAQTKVKLCGSSMVLSLGLCMSGEN